MSKSKRHPIPKPPHPTLRKEKLPWQSPKEIDDDPGAPARQQQLLNSPSYRQADQDVEFLNTDQARGIRLQLDYSKPELLLEQHDIRHTIVVFGSARLREPGAAQRHLQALEQALAAAPDDPALQRRCRVARQMSANSHYYAVARELGRLVGESGNGPNDCQTVVMTGGGPGIMEAANRGAHDVGAKTIGLNITLPHEQYPNPYITPELCFRFHYFALRKMHFLLRAKALIALPGGFGTLDELFETLTLIQTRKIPPLPVILIGEEYWRKVVDFEFLADQGVIDAEDLELFWFAETAAEAWEEIQRWHQSNGTPLFE